MNYICVRYLWLFKVRDNNVNVTPPVSSDISCIPAHLDRFQYTPVLRPYTGNTLYYTYNHWRRSLYPNRTENYHSFRN